MRALLGLLLCIAIVFMAVLKQTGVTPDLSWWWVACPLWGSTLAYYGVLAILFVVGSTVNALSSKKDG